MKSPFKELIGVFSHGFHTVTKMNANLRIHPFVAPFCSAFVSRTLQAYYSMLSSSSPSIGNEDPFVESKFCFNKPRQKYWENGFFLEPEEEESAYQIRRVILKVHNGKVEDVVQALQHDETSCRIRLSAHLVDGLLYKCGDDWKSALGFFQWADLQPGYKHTPHSYDKMVDLLGKMKQMDRMWDFVKEMHKRGFVTLGTITKIMRRLAGSGRWKDAIKVFDDLQSMGLGKDTESMNLLLDTLCKERKVEIAREVYINLKAHISPNAHTFNIFVHGWCNAHRIDEATWTIQEMKGCGFQPSVITYSTILQAHCNQSNFPRVYKLLDEMISDGCPPNVVTFTTIMHSLAKSDEFEGALSIAERMKSSGCKPDTLFYNSLINILGRAGRLREASQIFEVEMQMNGVSRNLSTYNTMISIFCRHFQEQNAMNVLMEMEKSSCRPVLQTYAPLLKLCFKAGKVDDQLNSLLGEMVNKHHLSFDLDTYTLLIHGLCSVDKVEWACVLFDEMIGREILPRIRTCKSLMHEAEQKSMDAVVERIKSLMKHIDNSP